MPAASPDRVESNGASEAQGTTSDDSSRSRGGRRANTCVDRVNHPYSRFEGREPSLKGHIYDIASERNNDQFIKTTKEVLNFIGRSTSKYTSELLQGVRDLELNDPDPPTNPDPTDVLALEIWKVDLKEYRQKLEAYQNFRASLYNLVLGQCTEALENRLKSHQDFANALNNGIDLLRIIKQITHTFEEGSKLSDALCDAKERFYSLRQGKYTSLQRHYEVFMNLYQVLDDVGVTIEDDALIESIAAANNRAGAPTEEDRTAARAQALTIRFIRSVNQHHKEYLRDLRNDFLQGDDNYPTTVQDAYRILQRREPSHTGPIIPGGDGIAFVTAGLDGRTFNNITCHGCGQVGHYANQCPNQGDGTNGTEGGG